MSIGTPRCSIRADTAANSPWWSATARSKFRLGHQLRQQLLQGIDVAFTVAQDRHLFFSSEWPTLHDAFLHDVLLFGADGVEPVVTQGADEALTFRRMSAIDDIAKQRIEIEHPYRHWPAEC
jgi:hypothetical protein